MWQMVTISSDIKVISANDEDTLYNSDSSNVVSLSTIKYKNDYGLRPLFSEDILNENWLQSAGKIKVTENPEGGYYADIANEAQLYIMSVGIKAGSLTFSTKETAVTWPYRDNSKTWKSEASWVGESLDKVTNDVWYPSIFQYFDFSDVENGYRAMLGKGGYSLLNCTNNNYNDKAHRTTYRLAEGRTYDMTTIPGYTGIGDNYTNNDSCVAGLFRANFDGNNSTIKVDIDCTSFKTFGYAGLFPRLGLSSTQTVGNEYIIGNFTLTGSVVGVRAAGGVCGTKYNGRYIFNNINLVDLSVSNTGLFNGVTYQESAGGMIGTINSNDGGNIIVNADKENDKTTVENISVSSMSHSAGIIGYGKNSRINNITMKNSSYKSENGHSAGIIAFRYENSTGSITAIDNASVTGCSFINHTANLSMGAIGGNINRSTVMFAMHDIFVEDNTYTTDEGKTSYVGKIVGQYSKSSNGGELGILKMDDLYTDTIPMHGNALSTDTKIVSIYFNDFCDLDAAEAKYGINRYASSDDETNTRYADLLDEEAFGGVDLIPDTEAVDSTIVKWSSDAGTIEQVINSLLDSLTNGTGKINDKYNDNISIDVVPMQVNHGVASETSGSAAIDIEKRDGTFIISNNNRYDTAEKTIDGVYTPGSYSIIRITYTIGGGEFEETVNLPFFVNNMVNVDIYSRTITGEEYSAEVMRNITNRDVLTVTKDSSYTVYTEYMYSSNRTEFEEAVYVNKLFRFDNHAAPVIPVGTKLTMVDVTEDQPHVYYYEVKKQLAEVPLTDFKDEDGNAYKERDISRLSELPQHNVYSTVYFNGRHFTKYNRGVERYFIFVDCSRVATEGNLTELESQITPSIVQNDSLNNPETMQKQHGYQINLVQ